MPLNFGYVGVGKETTPGTAVAPTIFFVPQELAEVRANAELAFVPNWGGYGDLGAVPARRSGSGRTSVVVTPRAIGAALHALLGNPTTTGTNPNYQHVFTPKTAFPSYTLEAQDGVAIHRLVGAQASAITFRHDANGYLVADVEWVGMDRTSTGTAATPSLELVYFTVGQVAASIGGSSVAARVESVEVSLSFPKTPFDSLDQVPARAVYPTGESEVTARLTLLFDTTGDANRLADYLAATSRAVSLSWTRDTNTSIAITFDAVLTEDPWVASNRDTGMARVQLALRAVLVGTALVTITLKNQQASY